MRRFGRSAVAILVAGVGAACLGAVSRIESGDDAAGSTLKLSWRIRGHHVEQCHTLTPAELEKLPVHMRRPEVCEGRMAPYTLTLRVDGVLLDSSVVTAAGARQDRPVYVYREVRLVPGAHHVVVTFARDSLEKRATERETAHPVGREPPEDIDAPVHVFFDRLLELGQGEVALVTYDTERSGLVLRGGRASAR